MKRSKQKGVALIFALIFILVLSITAASLMFLSQSETWSSLNYRLMTQSRYGAEAGLHAAANYLMNTYPQPGVSVTDPLSAYNMTVSPVTLAAGVTPIALGPTMNGISANYPIAATLTNFNTNTQGSLTAGNNTVSYSVSAELLVMRQVRECQNLQNLTAQLWRLTSHGDIGVVTTAVRNAEVEVSALLESHVLPCYNYAGFATGNGCGSISFNGGGTIDSYNSTPGIMTLSARRPLRVLPLQDWLSCRRRSRWSPRKYRPPYRPRHLAFPAPPRFRLAAGSAPPTERTMGITETSVFQAIAARS